MAQTQSFEIPETRCGGYGLLTGVRLGLLGVGLGAVWFLLAKEISRKGLTTLGELGTVILRRETD